MKIHRSLLDGEVEVIEVADIPYKTAEVPAGTFRVFEGGATRDQDKTKPDFEGFLSPLVIERFGEYMTKHRQLPDNSLRIPITGRRVFLFRPI